MITGKKLVTLEEFDRFRRALASRLTQLSIPKQEAPVIDTIFTGLTSGSIPFIGPSGVFAEDNAGLNWNNSSKILAVYAEKDTGAFTSVIYNAAKSEYSAVRIFPSYAEFASRSASYWSHAQVYDNLIQLKSWSQIGEELTQFDMDPTTGDITIKSVLGDIVIETQVDGTHPAPRARLELNHGAGIVTLVGAVGIDLSAPVVQIRYGQELHFLDIDESNYAGFVAPDDLTGDVLWKLPAADSIGTQALISDGAGNLGFSDFLVPVGYKQYVDWPASPTSQDDHFDDAAISAKWVNFQVDASITIAESGTHLKVTKATEATEKLRGKYQTLPSGDFTITAKVSLIGAALDYQKAGLALFEDATNNPNTCDIEFFNCFFNATVGDVDYIVQYYDDFDGTVNTNEYALSPGVGIMSSSYLRIRQNGTNWYFDISRDGIQWQQIYTRARRFAPAEFGILVENINSGATFYAWFDWITYQAADNVLPNGQAIQL